MLRSGTGEGTPLCHCLQDPAANTGWGGERLSKTLLQPGAQIPSLPWKIKHNSNESFFPRHWECLTLAATSIAWSPTALRGGRRSVSTKCLALVTWHCTWHSTRHLLSSLESQKLLAWEKGKGQHNIVQTCSTLQARDASLDPRTASSMDRPGVPTLSGDCEHPQGL